MHSSENTALLTPDIRHLIRQFDSGTVSLTAFHHREHLIIAVCYAALYRPNEALHRVRTGLQRILAANGKPPEAYKEALTALWMERAHGFLAAQSPAQLSPETIAAWLVYAAKFR